jgi:DNA adenine methylase
VALETTLNILRYPGGKQRHLPYFSDLLPNAISIKGCYIEPFVGGASVFLSINPTRSILADINEELIELYKGIKSNPKEVWKIYSNFPNTKKGYYEVREQSLSRKSIIYKAARILFLNRTCFKGMWRHNSIGKFNVGYGGQSRRWVIDENSLIEVSKRLKNAQLFVSDFEQIISLAKYGDFIFLDPPYTPGATELKNDHYQFNSFSFENQKRLAHALEQASRRGVNWLMTTSSHPDITNLFKNVTITPFTLGTGDLPGILTREKVGEVLIMNWRAT